MGRGGGSAIGWVSPRGKMGFFGLEGFEGEGKAEVFKMDRQGHWNISCFCSPDENVVVVVSPSKPPIL